MARKPNYQYEKRQRDLAKKKKKEEKRLEKLARRNQKSEPDSAQDESQGAVADDAADAAQGQNG